MSRIGFVGLGHMGLPMALNLITAGHTLTGFDLQSSPLETLRLAGGIPATRLQDAALSQDVIITMLQTSDQVDATCLGKDGLFAHAAPGTRYIDCSSIDVQRTRHLHEEAIRHGVIAIDAPVSGGVMGATKGTLTMMVGGTSEAFEAAKPILSALGQQLIHTGAAGSGQAAKICNNMILGISMIAVSEAFILAKALGLEDQKLFDVVSRSSGSCWALTHYVPVPGILEQVPANNDYQPGFSAAMMLKDLYLSQESAANVGIQTPMGERAAALYQTMINQGMNNVDFSGIINVLEETPVTDKL